MVNNSRDTTDFDGNSYIKVPEPKKQERISLLETFIPKAIVYIPVIGEVARPIIFKLIENLSNKHEKANSTIRAKVFQIHKYYKNVNQGWGSANSIVLFIASFVFMVASPYLGIASLPLMLGLIGAAVIIGLLPLFTLKENIRYFENPCSKELRKEFPNQII